MRARHLTSVLLVLCACASSTPDALAPNKAPGSPRAAVLAPLPTSSPVATTLAISAKLTDSVGVVIPNQVVNFVVTRGKGTVFAPATQSSLAGIVSNQWTLGVGADTQRVEIRWIDPVSGAPRTLATASVVATPLALDSLYTTAKTWGSFGLTKSPARLTLNAFQDKYGNTIPFRILADARLTVQDTIPGTDGARIASFTATAADGLPHTTPITGTGGIALATLVYQITIVAGTPMIDWAACGLKVTPCPLPPL